MSKILEKAERIVNQKLTEAWKVYDVFDELCNVEIRFDLKGTSAGWAGYSADEWGNRKYYLRFNIEMIHNHWDYFVNGNLPHEIAHLVCYMIPALGKNHDKGWKKVCIALGGTGKRNHSLPLTPARKMKKFLYTATCGTPITLSANLHNKIQNGQIRRLCSTGGKLHYECEYVRVA